MKEQIKAKHLVKGLQLVKFFYKANAFFLIIFILFSFNKDNFNITFYNTNIKLLTLVLLKVHLTPNFFIRSNKSAYHVE